MFTLNLVELTSARKLLFAWTLTESRSSPNPWVANYDSRHHISFLSGLKRKHYG